MSIVCLRQLSPLSKTSRQTPLHPERRCCAVTRILLSFRGQAGCVFWQYRHLLDRPTWVLTSCEPHRLHTIGRNSHHPHHRQKFTPSTPSAEIHTIHTIGRNSHPRQKFTPSTSSAEIHTIHIIDRYLHHPHHRQKLTPSTPSAEIHSIHTICRNSHHPHHRQKFTPSAEIRTIHTSGRNSRHPHQRQKSKPSTPAAEIHSIHTIGRHSQHPDRYTFHTLGRNSHPRQKFTPSTSWAEINSIHTVGRNSLHPHHRQKFTTQKKGEEEPEKNRGKDRGRNDVSCSLWKLLSLVTRSKSKHCWRSIPLEVLAHLSFCRLVD